eukprot:1701830-Pleurochrysis_carterae.AAC.1
MRNLALCIFMRQRRGRGRKQNNKQNQKKARLPCVSKTRSPTLNMGRLQPSIARSIGMHRLEL